MLELSDIIKKKTTMVVISQDIIYKFEADRKQETINRDLANLPKKQTSRNEIYNKQI